MKPLIAKPNLNRPRNLSEGFAAVYLTYLVMIISAVSVLSISILVYGQQKIIQNTIKSSQAYYIAESGIEDALLRLSKKMSWSSPYSFSVGSGTASVTISEMVGGSRTINSEGSATNRNRKIQAIYSISTDSISFHYGAQIGDGGMVMGNGSKVLGNIYSNGSVIGGGSIQNSIIVAGNGNKIEGLTIGGDAAVHTCKDSTITGTLTCVSGGSQVNCKACIKTQPNEIPPKPLPITNIQIGEWTSVAASGGIIDYDYTVSDTTSLGPIQIGTPASPKNLTIANGAHFILTGTIYVTGDINLENGSITDLDSSSYADLSGIILADGKIDVKNNSILTGTGVGGSYLLILSTKSDIVNPVISVMNNAAGAIFYAGSGLIYLNNNMKAREITGYKIQLNNLAEIQYESGLEDAAFTSGPGGTMEVTSWKEIE